MNLDLAICEPQLVRTMPTLALRELGQDDAQHWDELLAPFPTRELFHRKAWLDYLAASRHVQILQWEVTEANRTVGYFCGGILRKGPFRILGSPLKGWTTNFMGPVINDDVDHTSVLRALDLLAAEEHLAMVEMEYRTASNEAMRRGGYEPVTSWTYQIQLDPGNPEQMLRRMDKSRRYGIRKAIKAGLTVEDASDPAVADEYYEQFTDVLRRKRQAPPYPLAYAQLLHKHLKKAGHLYALRVRDARGRLLATGLFPHDESTVYYWGGASVPEARQHYANDFLHWQAMCLAADQGLQLYDLSGWGRFKKEFGGRFVTLNRWHKCYSHSAQLARKTYELYFKKRNRMRGWLQAVSGVSKRWFANPS
jgi:hypothetical protein